ncbi:MAG: hypothetical protein IKL94_03015 [Clostridia bacterium]|nr:hypothetical protein [Clostridia bacterium]
MARKSETLKQREKAQRDLLELKKMQQGILPQKEEVSVSAQPQTFREKRENFFYHYKTFFIGGLILLAVLTFLIADTLTKTKYDSNFILFADEIYSSEHIEHIEQTLKKRCVDADDNGEINISVIDCTFNKGSVVNQYELGQRSKVQARIASGDTMLFLLDEQTLAELRASLDYELFPKENTINVSSLFKEEFEKIDAPIKEAGKVVPNRELFLCLRRIDGSAAEKNEEQHNAAKTVFENVKKILK